MWRVLLTWPVLGAVVLALVINGAGLMTRHPPRFMAAQISFGAAAILLVVKTGWWLAVGAQAVPLSSRLIVACTVLAVVGVWWVAAATWARRR